MQQLPQQVFTSAEVRYIEQVHAKSHNGHCYDLMEKAGRSVFNHILKDFPHPREVWIFCGRGNNGGDGYVVALCLIEKGINHRVFASGRPHEGSEACIAFEYYQSKGGRVEFALPQEGSPEVIVDALLGTGIKSAPKADAAEWILFINDLQGYKIAIDVPSGVMADTGFVPGNCVKADKTVCMLALKPGILTADAVDYTGELCFESLGINVLPFYGQKLVNGNQSIPYQRLGYEDIVQDLPVRVPSSNKGDSGKVLLIAGAFGMGGAAAICGVGALRAGAGLVKIATDPDNVSAINALRPELMTLNMHDEEALSRAICWADVIAIGPGLGKSSEACAVLHSLDGVRKPIIADADALNLIAEGEFIQSERLIITPHPAEAGRLLHISAQEVNQDRFTAAFNLHQSFGGVVLLKGAGTVIYDGKRFTIISEGSPAMAAGGMGDLLTGMIAALLAQGLSLNLATVCASIIHGRAGELSAMKNGIIGTLPLDLCPYIRKLVNGIIDFKS